ncbi:MAG: radical SAM protein [Alphaproteobacteria bacterium]
MTGEDMAAGGDGYLTTEEILAWAPDREFPEAGRLAEPLIERLKQTGLWNERQVAGRRWTMGCVALEITQRCNLDCTLCYLSENAEAVKDIPLEELFRRIDAIYRHYGPDTDVQVTGGDPTLRHPNELVRIVKRIGELGMRPSLFTNGIKASRELLATLGENGLVDVAFHVDMTQQRRGFRSEAELNAVRLEYIERVRGLPLAVFFNTTVFDGNFTDIPDVVRFFRKHADVVSLASFQLQADTGRGVLRGRTTAIDPETVAAQISAGAGTPVSFDVPLVGHPACNRYGICLEANGNLYDLFDDEEYALAVLERTAGLSFDRQNRLRAVAMLCRAAAANPDYWWKTIRFLARKAWRMKSDVVRARGRVNKLSFFIHNFMDASRLERDRCKSCVFMVASADGPISMCVHNAKRDQLILKPFLIPAEPGPKTWDPMTGETLEPSADRSFDPASIDPTQHPLRRLKGRARQLALAQRRSKAARAQGEAV